MSRKALLYFAVFTASVFAACSVIKNEDPAQGVRTFLVDFQASLTKSDQDILQYFRVTQSRDAVLSVIKILQNKDKDVSTSVQFGQADITVEEPGYRITIPATFKLSGDESSDKDETTLVLWVTVEDKSFIITQFQGEEFYQAFTSFKNSNGWEIARNSAMESRLWVHEKARELETKFDSVIWYTTYGKDNFFYVVEGEWKNYFLDYENKAGRNPNVKMGLADSNGELIIPIAYDLVGTIGFERTGLVEVKRSGKVGYFDLDKKELVLAPEYDVIIPYTDANSCFAIVKKDTLYGWVTRNFEYHDGFPNERAKEIIDNYEFLPKNLRLKGGDQAFCEIPNKEYIGNGIVMPSTYLVANGLFKEIEGGITTTEVPMNAWTEYKETKGTLFTKISDELSAVVTLINERYLEGREEFYESNQVVFVNSRRDTVGQAKISGGELSIRTIEPQLLEVTTPEDGWFMENDASEEYNLTHYGYFAVAENGSVVKLESKRLFAQTQFVKLDSSYLSGSFNVYNQELGGKQTTDFLSLKTVTSMRDEILGDYNYAFPKDYHPGTGDWKLFEPEYTDHYLESMTEIDRHNLHFLDEVIKAMKSEQDSSPEV
jgi:hypothetical protein